MHYYYNNFIFNFLILLTKYIGVVNHYFELILLLLTYLIKLLKDYVPFTEAYYWVNLLLISNRLPDSFKELSDF